MRLSIFTAKGLGAYTGRLSLFVVDLLGYVLIRVSVGVGRVVVARYPLYLRDSQYVYVLRGRVPSSLFRALVLFAGTIICLFFYLYGRLVHLFLQELLLPGLRLVTMVLVRSVHV